MITGEDDSKGVSFYEFCGSRSIALDLREAWSRERRERWVS